MNEPGGDDEGPVGSREGLADRLDGTPVDPGVGRGVVVFWQAVAIIPAGVRTASPRPDLTTVPLYGVEPSHVVLAARADDRSRLVAAFRRSAQALLTGPGPAAGP